MMGPETIRALQNEAAARAAREGREPLVIWDPDEIAGIPSLGDYVPAGWRRATFEEIDLDPRSHGGTWQTPDADAYLWVDISGFGSDDEPALSHRQMLAAIQTILAKNPELTIGFALIEQGQFQGGLGIYVKDPAAKGTEVDLEAGLCPDCGEEDGVFDYHECEVPAQRARERAERVASIMISKSRRASSPGQIALGV